MSARNKLETNNVLDENGNPSGGSVDGLGLHIEWQSGPLGRPEAEPDGAFIDDLLEAVRQRLGFYQKAVNGKFACRENALAITKVEEAMHWLQARRDAREARGVQGTHTP